MAPLAEDQMIFLKKALESELVPLLPPLLKNTNSGEQQQRKNLSRAFSAFALQKICQISPDLAAAAVTDDFGEPLNQFVPLVEFAFDSPRGRETIANMSPGVAYAATTWQFAVEAVLPLNAGSGHGAGVRAQLLLWLGRHSADIVNMRLQPRHASLVGSGPPHQLRQLCDVGGDAPGLVAASRLALESERALAALVPDDGFRVG